MMNLHSIKTALIVPLSNERQLSKAHERGADALVLDLEDGVSADLKGRARQGLFQWARTLRGHGCALMVRVNNTPALLETDLRACAEAALACILVPKLESADDLAALGSVLETVEGQETNEGFKFSVVAGIESPAGVVNAVAIARHPRVAGLGFGPEDYCAALGVPSDIADLGLPAHQIALAAAAARRAAFGVPGTITDFQDEAAFERLVRRGRAMGFTGCMGIHPAQMSAARRAFAPTEAELMLAREIVRATETEAYRARGVISVRGRMVDAPVLRQALRTLEQAP